MTSRKGDVLADTLAVFDGARGEPLTANEVADALDCTRRAAYDRLERLADRGDVETKKVGARARVWWRPASDDDAPASDSRPESERELERYERIVENLPVGVYRNTPGPEGAFVEANERLAEIFDADSVDAFTDHSVSDLYPDPERRAEFSRRLRERGMVEDYELPQRTLDGREIWISVTAIATEEAGETYFDGIVQDVTERKERERQLESQREQLAALDELNAVVRDISSGVVEQSTRREIERTVCERLADSDSYAFAWTCELDPATREIAPSVAAGVDGYVEEVSVSSDPDDPAGQGPTGRAVQTGETQVVRDVFADPDYEPWRELAAAYDFRSSAAIPIAHQETLYGVLNVYTDREDAFAAEERAVVSGLGEIIGHAIAAVDRKQALMSDDVIELEFHMQDVFDELDVPFATADTIAFEETVSVGEDRFLMYGSVDEGATEALEGLCDYLPHFESVSIIDTEYGPDRFELRLSEPPVVSSVAARGGEVDRAVIEDGDYRMTIHLSPSVDVRRIIDAVEEAYPAAEMVTRRQVTRDESRARVERTLTEDLTDRQHAALEASFHAGYFDWPRASSGEDVAESLDVSPPTFHQHLRSAQRQVFEQLLG